MKRLVLVTFAMLLLAGFLRFEYVHAQAPSNSGGSNLEQPINEYEHQIASWKREATLEVVFVIAVIVFGPLIALFQKSSSAWAKTATVALGIATSILTGVNTQAFTADYRALKLAASEGEAITAQLRGMVAILNDPHTSEANRMTTQGLYFSKLAEFPAVIARLEGKGQAKTGTAQTPGLLVLPVVYAQSAAVLPGWVKQLPSDNYSLYFRGEGNDTSLSAAKTKSLNDAYNNALRALKAQAPKASDGDILALIKASAIVQDSAFMPSSNGQGYTYYTLLRLAKEIGSIGVRSLPAQPLTTFKDKNWRPSDLSSADNLGLLALDTTGGVSRLTADGQQGPHIETLFRVERSYRANAVAANAEAIFVASDSPLGCTVFRYGLADKKISRKIMGVREHCPGIATNGSVVYLAMSDRKEVKYWNNWSATPQSWSLADMDKPGPMVFDPIGNRLIVAGSSGKAYAISPTDGRQQVLASNLGAVTSIATSKIHILFGSGKRILFVARSDNHGENPPANLQLTGGSIVGVAVDATGNLWFADYDNQLVTGPFSLS